MIQADKNPTLPIILSVSIICLTSSVAGVLQKLHDPNLLSRLKAAFGTLRCGVMVMWGNELP